MLKILIPFLPFILFLGCSQKVPVTWKDRVLHKKVEHLPLVFTEYGDKRNPTLLFLHGFGENRQTWRFIAPYLVEKYHLVMIDLKGFGDSPKSRDDYYSVYDQAYVVDEFIKKEQLKNITLVGRSFGGGVALVLALIQEDNLIEKRIDKLVLINSIAYNQPLPSMLRDLKIPVFGCLGIYLLSNRYMAKEAYRYAFYNNKLIPKESVDIASAYLSFPWAKYAYLKTVNQLIPDDIDTVELRFKEITLPTLILWGKEDVAISVNKAYRLHRELRNSRLTLFPKAGHMPQEEIPYLVSDEIIKFMEETK
jgi:pimeloyl-ACP methyl ester carboxylesterase